MRQKQFVIFILFLALVLALVACGGKESEPAATAVPATTAAANPAADFKNIKSDLLGVAIGYPGDWTARVDDAGGVQIASDAALLADDADTMFKGAMVAITSFEAEMLPMLDSSADATDPVSALNVFANLITQDDALTFTPSQAAAATTIKGKPAARMVMDVSGEEGKGKAYFAAILDGPRIVYILGAAEEGMSDFAATYDAMLGTLALTTPAAAAAPEVVAEAPTVAVEPTATTPPRPTLEPTPEPEPTAVPGPSYVDIDVDPGIYLYTSGDFIRDMTLHDGKVWIASLGGVLAWDAATGSVRKYTTQDGLPHVGIFGIEACPMPEMTLLAGTEAGLAAYDPASDSWYLADNIFKTQPVAGLLGTVGADIGELVCDAANNRLIMEHKGVTIVNLADSSTRNVPGSDLSWSGVRDLTLVGNQIWVSSGYRGYTVLDGEQVRPFSKNAGTFDADTIYHIAAAPNGDIWMAASEGLLQVRNNQVINTFNRDNTPGFSTPYHVAFDANGAMWVGFLSRLCQFDPASRECKTDFKALETPGMVTGEIAKILFDDAGHIYYHVFEGGWSYFDGEQWRHFQNNDLPMHAVQTVFDDAHGNIWLLGGSAYTFNNDLELKDGWEKFRDMGGDDIAADANGGIWLTTGRNLYHYDGFQIKRYQVADGLFDSYARAVAVMPDGRVWVGQENGVSIWDGQKFIILNSADNGWPEGRIQTLLADGDVLWAGTDKGLLRIENDQAELVLYQGVVGLPSYIIYALGKLPDGRLAVGTAAGLVYYDHAGRSLAAEPEVTAAITDIAVSPEGELIVTSASDAGGGLYIHDEDGWLYLTTADGLPTDRLRTVLVDSAGTLWIGGGYWGYGGGVMRFVP
ncbi:MAG: hypothetical protein HND44_19205 [Chloroflexi bacterium]|nr:hypothetical protein [Ardenticatenaceae bacterium]MBL1130583.1 hypothetical protein [Chloroflexota bacterium]NOG36674.1 hypothetical protein [Chloroflexota bacterium]GIK57140.1 MAG: hypothetical protein BroJett015_28030 [Chloroflexota bacterium]